MNDITLLKEERKEIQAEIDRLRGSMNRADLTCSEASRLVSPDFETGRLYWLKRTPDMFADGRHTKEHTCCKWNSRFAGKEAFTGFDSYGYRAGRIYDREYKAHRLLWLLYSGRWPDDQIDHINGDKADNRIANLRAVPQSENNKNKPVPTNNTSGVIGVHRYRKNGYWQAEITVNGKARYLGRFRSIEEAAAARKAAEIEFGFHENHGRPM